ncbi:MAG: DUF924 domain-containing protein [Bdellovibrionaceae bacterium]|nr:DUF924 domain-containing protein [Pseudobdellovibrionaceae bacterium]
MTRDPQELIQFWFGDLSGESLDASRLMAEWFTSSAEFDEELRARFGPWLEDLEAGHLESWLETPRGRQAWVLLTDQVPRNIFRGTPRAFRYDGLSREVARSMVRQSWDLEFHPLERIFLYLPFEHSEALEDQNLSVELFENLAAQAPPAFKDLLQGTLDYAHRHLEPIRRFGRFPHRNDVLGRESTPEEQAYLASGQGRF